MVLLKGLSSGSLALTQSKMQRKSKINERNGREKENIACRITKTSAKSPY